MEALIDESVTALAGPKFEHNPDRAAVRHGTEVARSCWVGGSARPPAPVRIAGGSAEVTVPAYAYELFSSTELLGEMALERLTIRTATEVPRNSGHPPAAPLGSIEPSSPAHREGGPTGGLGVRTRRAGAIDRAVAAAAVV